MRKRAGERAREGPPEAVEEEGAKPSAPASAIRKWLVFLNERAPPLVFLLLAAGPCLSGLYTAEGYVSLEKFLWAVVGELVLLLLIRVMDDVKDYEKDKIVHPERPLPRGLLKYDDVVNVINWTFVLMMGYAGFLTARFTVDVGLTFTLQVIYAFLMYVEFGVGEWLEQRPFLYGLTHQVRVVASYPGLPQLPSVALQWNAVVGQVSIYFGAMFICSLGGVSWNSLVGFLLGSVAFSGFFTYEICRKLDPTLPKLKGTYLVIYGKWPTFFFTVATVSVGVVSSYALGLHRLLWPLEALMIVALLVLFLLPVRGPKPRTHKPVEALAILYVLLHMWAPYLAGFILA